MERNTKNITMLIYKSVIILIWITVFSTGHPISERLLQNQGVQRKATRMSQGNGKTFHEKSGIVYLRKETCNKGQDKSIQNN